MLPTRQGSLRLFRFGGIEVFLHWSWFVVALYEIQNRTHQYSSPVWNALEYLSLFLIVLLHEFGHSLACRQVGGKADQIVLWPLGGVAYVAPPQRPGAMLWSIAAGPLVNVVLAPILTVLMLLGRSWGWDEAIPNGYTLIRVIWQINLALLIFNLLPIYPLDGGQILRSLLWFVLGRARSLMAATIIGFIGVAGLVLLALYLRDIFFGVICVFILLNCWRGLMQARILSRLAKLPRRSGYACPDCRQPPALGAFWRCGKCLNAFDTFQTQAVCPHCGAQFPVTQCLDCGSAHPFTEWLTPAAQPPRY
jgi:Zn-dependent protease